MIALQPVPTFKVTEKPYVFQIGNPLPGLVDALPDLICDEQQVSVRCR